MGFQAGGPVTLDAVCLTKAGQGKGIFYLAHVSMVHFRHSTLQFPSS